MVSLAED
ncbi:hypothetical protein VTL71DRAFT_3643 [Oculimacula yallundae]